LAELISVVLPTRDRPQLLVEAIASVVQQRHREWELLVVNDGGESVAEVVRRSHDPRVRLIELPRALGPAAARNVALGVGRGTIVAYLDDDDLILPDHLALLAEALAGAGTPPVAYTDIEHVALREAPDGAWREVGRERAGRAFAARDLQLQNFVPLICLAHTQERWREVGGFDPGLSKLEDWELLLRLTAGVGATHIPQVTARCRHFAGLDRVNDPQRDLVEMTERIYLLHPARDEALASARRRHLVALAGLVRVSRRRLQPALGRQLQRMARALDLGQVAEAEQTLRALTDELPNDGELLSTLSNLLRVTGRCEEAARLSACARARDPYLFVVETAPTL
jgi:O-antigen biosynthesis protein